MLRGKNRLSRYLHQWSFEGILWKYLRVFVRNGIYPKAALAFVAGSSVAGLGIQKDNSQYINTERSGRVCSTLASYSGTRGIIVRVFRSTPQ
jgi:hypothetical protein